LLSGLEALDRIVHSPGFGLGERTIGTELELFLLDGQARALPIAPQVVRSANDPLITPEMGTFDIELAVPPSALAGRPFTSQGEHLRRGVASIREHAAKFGARVVPISILPTLRRRDFGPASITDLPRYRALANGMQRLREAPFEISIHGDDPLYLTSNDAAMEAANTAFQVHLRVQPHEFANIYNAAAMVTGPALAAAGNSPTFLGHRLWEETRVALFKQAGDDRPPSQRARLRMPSRVGFGTGWVREGVYELFAESVALHEPLLAECCDEEPLEVLARGQLPSLYELRLHHGTVWKWNRPVYDPRGEGHLRIELRALPAGPTVDDMLANAAFLLGATLGLAPRMQRLLPAFPFPLAERNFYNAARSGLAAELVWPQHERSGPSTLDARSLLLSLVTLAAEGLASAGVDSDEAGHWLGIFQERVMAGVTGARWQRAVLERLQAQGQQLESALSTMLEFYMENVASGLPVHAWKLEP
jgi:gamma-glutamyl:cysteine ligase YbdK (ATP-grasp superfamily)